LWHRRHADQPTVAGEECHVDDGAEQQPQVPISWTTKRLRPAAMAANGSTDVCAAKAAHDVSLRALRSALAGDSLPAFVFITPNMCHSMHNCSVGTGDRWLRHMIRVLAATAAYPRGTMAAFVTFDESDKNSPDDRIATFVISPSTPPHTRAGAPFNHYALLRTTEEMLGLDPLLGQAQHARSMRSAFNL
jgi:hypothetical protein